VGERAEFELREMPCAACGGTARTHVGWRGGAAHHSGSGIRVEIVRCNSCTHLYPHPMPFPKAGVEEIYTETDSYFSAHDLEQKKQSGRQFMKEIESRLGRRGTVLDIGCGRGELLWAAHQSGWDCVGLDPSPEYVEWARTNFGVEARLGTLEQMAFADASFDVAIMNGVIEHLYEPFRTLTEVLRVLKPDGLFYFDAPNEDGLYMRAGNVYMRARGRDGVLNLAPTFPPYHVQGFNPRSLKHLLTRVGFDLIELSMGGTVTVPAEDMSLAKRLEFKAARAINWLDKQRGAGVYMAIWAKKPAPTRIPTESLNPNPAVR